MDKVKGLDLYLLLEVESDADDKTIRKAYRKKALSCHPDKNPDNKEAVALFHQLSDALEVLTDVDTRKAYDNVLKAKKAAELRTRALDGKRRKLKDDLEQREKDAKFQEVYDKKSDEEKLAREIARLRKEGSTQLEEEQEYMKRELAKESMNKQAQPSGAQPGRRAKLKVKWTKSDDSPYNRESLEKIFSKYGEVTAVVVNAKKGGSALVEFEDNVGANMAAKIETGFFGNPLKVKSLVVEEEKQDELSKTSQNMGSDFESIVLRKLRQEEERKRLIAQMMAEDDNS